MGCTVCYNFVSGQQIPDFLSRFFWYVRTLHRVAIDRKFSHTVLVRILFNETGVSIRSIVFAALNGWNRPNMEMEDLTGLR